MIAYPAGVNRFITDSCAPTFANLINGQVNLRDAIRRQIDFEQGGKSYKLIEKPAVLIIRCVRFWTVFLSSVLTFDVIIDPEAGI